MKKIVIKGHLMCYLSAAEFSHAALVGSSIASERYRGGILTGINALGGVTLTWAGGDVVDPSADLLVIGKPPMADKPELDRWALSINKSSAHAKVVLDYTDHHLARGANDFGAEFYQRISDSVDLVVCPTEPLGVALSASWQRKVPTRVIYDPIEFLFRQPKDSGRRGIETIGLWFGHPTNISYLDKFLKNHAASFVGQKIVVVTAGSYITANNIPINTWMNHPAGAKWLVLPWSVEITKEASQLCDYAILPVDANDPKKNSASPNRLINALALGLPVITTPLHSNSRLEEYFCSTDNKDGWEGLIQDPTQGHPQVIAFQSEGSAPFSKAVLEDEWRKVLVDLVLDRLV